MPKKWQFADIEDEWFNKMLFDPAAGDHIEIYWIDRENPDYGYLFTLPSQDISILDCCVHVPQMDNSDGIGYGEEIHLHLMEVLSNNRVEQVIKQAKIN